MADNKLIRVSHLKLLAVRCAALVTSKVSELATATADAMEELSNSTVRKAGDTMTGDLAISKAIPAVTMQVPDSEANAILRKNANASADYGTHIVDTASEGNYTQITLGHVADEFILTRYENGQPVGVYKIYHEGNKPTLEELGGDAGGSDYTYGTTDLTAGSSALETGKLYFVYE